MMMTGVPRAPSIAKSNKLKEVSHHRVDEKRQNQTIELGNIVFYFERSPKPEKIATKKSENKAIDIISIPSVEIASEKEKEAIAQQLTKHNNEPYSIEIKLVPATKGIEIVVTYDNNKVIMDFGTYDSIGLNKGVVFRFYNKPLLKKLGSPSKIVKTVYNKVVVIDCGHGGIDPGAVGCHNIQEKDVCLQIGLEVAHLLSDEGITAHLARDSDCTVALDARTTKANRLGADLFVSIHANSSPNKSTTGIETYCINHNLFCPLSRNKAAWDHVQGKYKESNVLAKCVHDTLIKTIRNTHNVIDRRVRYAVSQVLVGTTMPAILIEAGFLTNEKEAQLLADASYQKQVARGISRGILTYLTS